MLYRYFLIINNEDQIDLMNQLMNCSIVAMVLVLGFVLS